MKKLICFFAVLLVSLSALSCGNDAIFHAISLEDAPATAMIEGSPQNIVVTSSSMYAWRLGGSNVWSFGYDNIVNEWRWRTLPRPGGVVGGLAAIGDYVFAVDGSSQIRRHNPTDDTWDDVGISNIYTISGYTITRLFCAGGNVIFARAHDRSRAANQQYVILAFSINNTDLSGTVDIVREGSGDNNLMGVTMLGSTAFLATGRDGIFSVATSAPSSYTEHTPPSPFNVTGIIATASQIVVVGSSGTNPSAVMYILPNTSVTEWPEGNRPHGTPSRFTGGLGFWYAHDGSAWNRRLLLAGTQRNARLYGYMEFDLDSNGNLPAHPTFRVPGAPNPNADPPIYSSLQRRERYDANIGNRSVRFIQQAPNLNDNDGGNFFPDMTLTENQGWEPPIFASTARAGLWVFYFRASSGNGSWRAEDNSIIWR